MDSTQWDDSSVTEASDPFRFKVSSTVTVESAGGADPVVCEADRSDGTEGFPTLSDGPVRFRWKTADEMLSAAPGGGFSWIYAINIGDETDGVPYNLIRYDEREPLFPLARSASAQERHHPGEASGFAVSLPAEAADFDFTLHARFAPYWSYVDLAELILSLYKYQSGGGLTARDLLDRASFLDYSERQQDPRYRQKITVWWKDDQTITDVIEGAAASTDAILAFGVHDPDDGLTSLLAIRDPSSCEELAYPIVVDDTDPGASAFLTGHMSVDHTDEFLINERRIIVGNILETTTPKDSPSTTILSELEDEENVVVLRDENSIADYGVVSFDDRREFAADVASAIGPTRASTWSSVGMRVTIPLGPIGFDIAPGDIIRVQNPDCGLDGTERLFVVSMTIDWSDLVVTVEAIEYADPVADEFVPADATDLYLHLKADVGVTDTSGYCTGWANQSPLDLSAISSSDGDLSVWSNGGLPPAILSSELDSKDVLQFSAGCSPLRVTNWDETVLRPPSILVAALIRPHTPVGSGSRVLLANAGGSHKIPGYEIGVGSRWYTSTVDDLEIKLGTSSSLQGAGWRETGQYMFGTFPGQATEYEDVEEFGRTSIAPGTSWAIYLFSLEHRVPFFTYDKEAAVTPDTYLVSDFYPWTDRTKTSLVAVIDPTTGDLVEAAHRMRYGVRSHAHWIERFILGTDVNGTANWLEADLAELLVFLRESNSPEKRDVQLWTPADYEGLVTYLRTRWGFA